MHENSMSELKLITECLSCGDECSDCQRCGTSNACACHPCECEYVSPIPRAKELMALWDAAEKRKKAS